MSDFWRRKLRMFFTLLDFDKDGVMSRDDWVGLPTSLAKFEKADKQKSEHLVTQFRNVWELYTKYVENKNRLTIDEFVDSILKQRYDPELMKRENSLIHGFFKLMDMNDDGYLDEEEHKRLFDHSEVPDTSWTKATFQAMDVNGDGKLSVEEFVNGFYDYCYSEDENSPNKNFFGPLVN